MKICGVNEYLQGIETGKKANRLEREAISKKELQEKKYQKGRYKVKHVGGFTSGKFHKFEGELIQQTKDFVTLRDNKGIVESFLKVDFEIESKIEKVG